MYGRKESEKDENDTTKNLQRFVAATAVFPAPKQ
jgi:hypothetical protein